MLINIIIGYSNTSKMQNNYVFWFAVAFVLLTLVQSAPLQHRRRHQRSWSTLSQPKNMLSPNEWKNPCNYDQTSLPPERKQPNATVLRSEMVSFVSRLKTLDRGAIDTGEVNQWEDRYDNQYSFLHRINKSSTIVNLTLKLRKWHTETQVYCGAFQWLYKKQLYIDNLKNEGGKNKSEELKDLFHLSRNLLCEIETAMGVEPKVLSESTMQARLKFNNHQIDTSSQEVYDIDNQFAKDRFTKYLLNMQTVLNKKQHLKIMKKSKNQKRKECRRLRKQINDTDEKHLTQDTRKIFNRNKRKYKDQNCLKVLENAKKQKQKKTDKAKKRLNISHKV